MISYVKASGGLLEHSLHQIAIPGSIIFAVQLPNLAQDITPNPKTWVQVTAVDNPHVLVAGVDEFICLS